MNKFADIPRDISWLSFNHRVLQEAANPKVPLFERIKFLAIYSSNLDEFFRVRVAALRSFKQLRKKTRRSLELKPKRTLNQVFKTVDEQQNLFGETWRNSILPELKKAGVELLNTNQVIENYTGFAENWFAENSAGKAEILTLNSGEAAPFLQNKGQYFAFMNNGVASLIGLPLGAKRFIVIPREKGEYAIAWADDLVRAALPNLIGKGYSGTAYAVKLSRDAEIYIEDEFDGDLVQKIRKGLGEREIGLPTRFLFQEDMDETLLAQLVDVFELSEEDLVAGAPYHNFSDLFGFPDPLKKPEWYYPEEVPHLHSDFENANSLFDLIKEKDRILHFPYQSFNYVSQLLEEAADDPAVEFIKITFYRVSNDSPLSRALIRAVENGKQVTAFLEIKARFDEQSNLLLGAELEKAGVKVIYSYAGIKVHTKLFIIGRREDSNLTHYAYLGTGNFNEKTARIYCDHALLSADSRLTEEALQIFEVLERIRIITKTKHLLVSPFSLRERFEDLIEAERQHALAGRDAWIIAKMNSLEDPEMITALKQAASD
ncbi:MAG: polyphosphate kinase, partial [Limisphaerales bacterium]